MDAKRITQLSRCQNPGRKMSSPIDWNKLQTSWKQFTTDTQPEAAKSSLVFAFIAPGRVLDSAAYGTFSPLRRTAVPPREVGGPSHPKVRPVRCEPFFRRDDPRHGISSTHYRTANKVQHVDGRIDPKAKAMGMLQATLSSASPSSWRNKRLQSCRSLHTVYYELRSQRQRRKMICWIESEDSSIWLAALTKRTVHAIIHRFEQQGEKL
jgi:hypothetical protein